MKSYVAYGENGKNKVFESKNEVLAFFEVHDPQVQRALVKGSPLEDPETLDRYYIDELGADECEKAY